MRKPIIEITPNYILGICFASLIFPLNLLFAWITAVVLHEAAHYIVLWLGKIEIYKIKVGLAGAVIDTAPMKAYLELICAAAGPLASLTLLIFIRKFPLLSMCAAFQAFYNLLPLPPLDGWRILKNLIECLGLSMKICNITQFVILLILALLTCYLTFRLHLGPLPIIAMLFLFIKQKFSCKQRRKRVQ